ncbi:MAG: SDR family oxidoreductase [Alphaproteobacteria bacterium]|nr:SDR family oxidoreductase [Alphaproteobacteria bacterium]
MKHNLDLAGRHVLITGGAGGIGAATARISVGLGARVSLVDVVDAGGLVAELRAAGGDAVAHVADVADRAAVERVAAAAGPVDAVVANAGICPHDDWTADDWEDAFHRVMDVNVLGTLNCARAFLPPMYQRKRGRFVVIGSLSGRAGRLMAHDQAAHYIASKAGVHALVKWLARRSAPHGILVNGIAPGPTRTAAFTNANPDLSAYPLGRMGDPEEIAWPIAFLLSERASYICGAMLDVNGGNYMP